jgi:hypothetical protein
VFQDVLLEAQQNSPFASGRSQSHYGDETLLVLRYEDELLREFLSPTTYCTKYFSTSEYYSTSTQHVRMIPVQNKLR